MVGQAGWSDRAQSAAVSCPPVIPEPVAAYLGRLLEEHAKTKSGTLADYIPELAQASPDWFGISIATTDGAVYETGDSRQPFTLQSVSKPFVYGLALDLNGEEAVRRRVGVEPTGDAFNSISLAPGTGIPPNPMVNAGAIATTGLVAAARSDPGAAIRDALSCFAGRPLEVDGAVHRSEADTGFRNRAIAHLLRNFKVIDGAPEEVVDLYFEQCSVLVDCRDLALMAATLANGGLHPLTGERALSADAVHTVLSVMTSCGMYNSAGEWLHAVGLPAKSGVSGGVLAVVPGRLGIGVFSPPLDARGNSVRGIAVCRDLSRSLSLHLVDRSSSATVPIRGFFSLAELASRRVRTDAHRQALAEHGGRSLVVELQGELAFAAVELLARAVLSLDLTPGTGLAAVVVDLSRVERASPSVAPLLGDFLRSMDAVGARADLSAAEGHGAFVSALLDDLAQRGGRQPVMFRELDLAIECHEDMLLAALGAARSTPAVPLAEHELLRGLDATQLQPMELLLEPRAYAAGDLVFTRGERAEEILLVTSGEFSVALDTPHAGRRRLATVSAGMALGVLSVDDREGRTADVRADTDAECQVLALADFDALSTSDPALKCRLLENLLARTSALARRLDRELSIHRG